jgi:hypothetical protein
VSALPVLKNVIFFPGDEIAPHVFERPLLSQIYDVIEDRGELGMSQREVCQTFKLPKLESRMICRSLERLNLVQKLMRDVGKQREQRYGKYLFMRNI